MTSKACPRDKSVPTQATYKVSCIQAVIGFCVPVTQHPTSTAPVYIIQVLVVYYINNNSFLK